MRSDRALASLSGPARWPSVPLMLCGAALALAVRAPWLSFESADYYFVWAVWGDFIVANGYFQALGEPFSPNPPAYLYLLVAAARFLDWLPWVVAVKSLSIAFDFVLAFFVYQCVRVRHPRPSALPAWAFAATLLAPTVVLNSALWGQYDSIYAAFLAACLYGLLAGRQGWAGAALGAALAFKPQAIFLAPLFLWLLAKQAVDWRCLALAPGVVVASWLPAWLAGRPLAELLWVYPELAAKFGRLTLNAPNLYVWIAGPSGDDYALAVHAAACLLVAALVVGVAWVVRRSRVPIAAEQLVLLATFSVLLLPYILPKMHDRYFYAADVFAIVLAFFHPGRYLYVPLVVVSVSLLAYLPFLFDVWMVPPELLAAALLALLVAVGMQALRALGWPVRGTAWAGAAALAFVPVMGWGIGRFVADASWHLAPWRLYQTALASELLAPLGPPTAREAPSVDGRRHRTRGSSVYLDGERSRLIYVDGRCPDADARRWFLWAWPAEPADLALRQQEAGVDKREADRRRYGVRCVASQALPDYPIGRIRVGQLDRSGQALASVAIAGHRLPSGAAAPG